MKELNEARKTYEDTPIPEALGSRVQEGIRQGRARYRARRNRVIRRWSAAAACFCLVLAGLNLSPTVAQAAAQVPVLGGLFRVLTFVEYDRTEDGIHYDVSAPQVEAEGGLAEKVNAAIQEKLTPTLPRPSRTGTATGTLSLPPAARRRSGTAGRWMSRWTTRSRARARTGFLLS